MTAATNPESRWQWRAFRWSSSRNSDKASLNELQRAMQEYYSMDRSRTHYQQMLDDAQTSQPTVLAALVQRIAALHPQSIVELGCGSGWILEQLQNAGLPATAYTGAELSQTVIERNRLRQPDSKWIHMTDYETEIPSNSADVAYSYFVIEHCVFPERHLAELFRIVRPGGNVFLVCPNFVRGGILPSQYLGIADGNAGALLRKGKFIAAAIGLYDSRVRLQQALNNLSDNYEPFVINLKPLCLLQPDIYVPDVDAVYISCDEDLRRWSSEQNAEFQLPCGTTGSFSPIVFAQITKPGVS